MLSKVSKSPRSVMTAVAALLAIFMSVTGVAAPSNAATNHQVTVHYHRWAGDYTNWSMWLWPDKKPGAQYQFSGADGFGKTGTWTIPDSAGGRVGFLVRDDKWNKDVSDDRYIADWDQNSNAEIWLIEGDATIYTSQPKVDAAMRSASATSFQQIKVKLTNPMDLSAGSNGFSLASTGGSAPAVTTVTAVDGSLNKTDTVLVNLDSNLEFGNSYTLSQGTYGDKAVTLNSLYDTPAFASLFTYTGNDLGNTYTKDSTSFRVWAPTAASVELLTFASATTSVADATSVPMTKDVNGTWIASLAGDQNGTIYAYRVHVDGAVNVAVDPYVRATTVNGERGVVVDLAATDPAGFASETKPAFSGKPTDATIYELHVRDLSMDASSGVSQQNRGKYLAFTETNTKGTDGITKTGVSAIKALGVSHVELLPVFDFSSVDENNPTFNWGYDPQNYNVPEGSYSSDPTNPTARITELKTAIQSLHSQGLRVNMDVVYNHVANASAFSEQLIVPGYWFRYEANGALANGSGCGNEVASERPMVRKFIVDSVNYWATQYHFDGFRFDLMGLIDTDTMKQVRSTLNNVDPSILVIGEGWNMGTALPESKRAIQKALPNLPGVGAFNDGIRDGLKGSVFNSGETGWVTGKFFAMNAVQAGIAGETQYSSKITGTWGGVQPGQSVNYVEAHDNLTLYDKLLASTTVSKATLTKLDQLTASVVILAQGLPFQQAGQEFLRTKKGNDNSYNASDEVNSLKWDLAKTNAATVNYYAGLYAIRKAHPAFRMDTASSIRKNLKFINQSKYVISYSLNGKAVNDSASTIFVAHNQNSKPVKVNLPATATWNILVKGDKAGVKSLGKVKGKTYTVDAYSTVVLTK